jgi:hypothetical protein
MLEVLSFDGYSLAALAVVVVGVLVLVALLRRNTQVGVTRIGVFIERDYDDEIEIDQDTKVLWPKEDK